MLGMEQKWTIDMQQIGLTWGVSGKVKLGHGSGLRDFSGVAARTELEEQAAAATATQCLLNRSVLFLGVLHPIGWSPHVPGLGSDRCSWTLAA